MAEDERAPAARPPEGGSGSGSPDPTDAAVARKVSEATRSRALATAEGLILGLGVSILLWFRPEELPGPDLGRLAEGMARAYRDPARPGKLLDVPARGAGVTELRGDATLAQVAADELRRRGAPSDALAGLVVTRSLRVEGEAGGERPLYVQARSMRCEHGRLDLDTGPAPACFGPSGQPLAPPRTSSLIFAAPEAEMGAVVLEASVEVPAARPEGGPRLPAELYDVRDLLGDPRPEVVLRDVGGGGPTLRVLGPSGNGRWMPLIAGWTAPVEPPAKRR